MTATKFKRQHIVVIGAGVVGLQTAISLLEAGYRVTIVAKELPGDTSAEYTSPWAGAQWRTHAPASDTQQRDWDIQSYKHWMALATSSPSAAQETGIGIFRSTFHWATPTPESPTATSQPWWAPHMRGYTVLPSSSLPKSSHAAVEYDCPAIHVPVYLTHLLRTATQKGANILRAALPTATGLSGALDAVDAQVHDNGIPPPDAYVNATGLGARKLVPDENVYPIRGQTVLVNKRSEKILTREDSTPGKQSITYVIPRVGTETSVLGGTKEAEDWNSKPVEEVTRSILERTQKLWPEGKGAKVLAVQVGLRPGRKGGVRVEVERIGGRVVVHEYGHAGAGYQNSIGSAREVVRLVEAALGAKL